MDDVGKYTMDNIVEVNSSQILVHTGCDFEKDRQVLTTYCFIFGFIAFLEMFWCGIDCNRFVGTQRQVSACWRKVAYWESSFDGSTSFYTLIVLLIFVNGCKLCDYRWRIILFTLFMVVRGGSCNIAAGKGVNGDAFANTDTFLCTLDS